MTIIYHEEDGNLADLAGKRVGIIGYGKMGRPTALNLRDSGVDVLIGDHRAERRQQATRDGFAVLTNQQIAQNCHILMPLYRDEIMPQIYLEQVSPYLQRGQALIFASSYNVAFGFIEAPPFVDVGLVAACTFGDAMREQFTRGERFTSFVAVGQDASGHAWNTVMALALALGALRGGAVEVRFEQEAELDLFFQQAIIPALHHVMVTAANLLIDRGYTPEAVLTQLYLSGETADYFEHSARVGLLKSLQRMGLTAQFGALSRFDRFNDLKLERLMEVTLDEIRQGRFSAEWQREFANDYPHLKQLFKKRERAELVEIERDTIEMLHIDPPNADPHAAFRPPDAADEADIDLSDPDDR